MTNVLALDRAGNLLMEKTIEVRGPGPNVVVVYRGIERESYSCAPICERRITLGDSQAYFDAALGQTGSRTGQAQAKCCRRQRGSAASRRPLAARLAKRCRPWQPYRRLSQQFANTFLLMVHSRRRCRRTAWA